jgi:ankyrin repeat protein
MEGLKRNGSSTLALANQPLLSLAGRRTIPGEFLVEPMNQWFAMAIIEIIELLIEHGADINAKDHEGRTPVGQMLQNRREDLAEVLRLHGGDSA